MGDDHVCVFVNSHDDFVFDSNYLLFNKRHISLIFSTNGIDLV